MNARAPLLAEEPIWAVTPPPLLPQAQVHGVVVGIVCWQEFGEVEPVTTFSDVIETCLFLLLLPLLAPAASSSSSSSSFLHVSYRAAH